MEEEALQHECISPRKAPAPAPEVVGGDLTRSEIEALYAATTSAAGALAPAVDAALVSAFGARVALLPHQRSALAWMLDRERDASGGVLADEPGLGKTLTCLALVATDWAARGRKRARARPTLVVAPTAGVRAQWAAEASRFYGAAVVVDCYDGAPSDPAEAAAIADRLARAQLVVCDLTALRKERHFRSAERSGRGRSRGGDVRAPLFHVDWRRVVVDEVQDVEGRSAGADVARELPAERRWGVSGTPVGKGGLDALFGLFSFLGAEPYRDADWWAAHVRRPLKGGTRTERDAALATAGAAMAELVWRSRKAVASAPLLPASSAFRLKQQHFLPAAVVEPGAAEVAATRPGVADLLAGAVAAAADAGYEKCESELSSKDARALLSGAASKKKRRKGAQSFQGLCRAATAVALCETAAARGDDAPPAADEVSDWIRCDACDKWRKVPPGMLGEAEAAATWTCAAGSRSWRRPYCCDDREEPQAAAPAMTAAEAALAARGSLAVVLHRVAARGVADAQTASAALGHLALAAALRFQRGGVHTVFTTPGSYDEAGGSPFASEAVAFLLDAQSICRDGASADEVLANSRRGRQAAVAGRKLSGVPPSVLTVVLERLEVEQRQRVRRLRSDPNDDLAGGGGGLDGKLHFATMRALVYGRSRRRVATAMARHRRLGAASPARRCPNQAWPQIWAFVDGGAGDYVAEMLERVAAAARKQAFRATAGADARNLEARRDNVDHGAFEARALDLGVDGVFGSPESAAPRCLRSLVVACLHWAPPAGGPSSREYEEAYVEWCADGAGHLGALGRMETPSSAMAAPGPFWASRRAGDLDPRDLAPAAVFARRVRVAKAVRAVVESLGDHRQMRDSGAHEEALRADATRWCRDRGRPEPGAALAAADAARSLAARVAAMLPTASEKRVAALEGARAVAVAARDGRLDAVDAAAALVPARVAAARGDLSPSTPPAALEDHARCGMCRQGAWRHFANARRANLAWPRTPCLLCAARKATKLFRAYLVSMAFADADSALVRLVKAAADDGAPRGRGPPPSSLAAAAVAALEAFRLDANAAASVSLGGDGVAAAAANLRRQTFDERFRVADEESLCDSSAGAAFFGVPGARSATRAALLDATAGARARPSRRAGEEDPVAFRRLRRILRVRVSAGGALPARFAAAAALGDGAIFGARVAHAEATRAATLASAILAARGDGPEAENAACARCGAAAAARRARASPAVFGCGHALCGACVATDRALPDAARPRVCPACREDHALPLCRQPLADARHDRSRVDFGAKLDELADDVEAHVTRKGLKCLVFSSWTDALDLVAVALKQRGVASLALKGGKQAPKILEAFKADPHVSALLMNISTNNAGLNLSEATHVFLLDTNLDHARETQALARVQRLDSKSETTVHRYVTGGSIEDAIWQLRLSKATAAGELRTRVTKADVYDLFKSQLAAARGAE